MSDYGIQLLDISRKNTQSPQTSRKNTQLLEVPKDTQSPEMSRRNTQSLQISRKNTQSPQTSRKNTQSPQISRKNTQSPQISRKNTQSLQMSRKNTLSLQLSRKSTRSSQLPDEFERMSYRRSYSIQRLSFGRRASQKLKLVRTYQPTYQLKTRNGFNQEKVEKILKRIIDSELEEAEYSEKVIPELCMTLADMIRSAVKEEKYDRYRILVSVSIGQRRNQGVHIYHSFLWDPERDAFVCYNFENSHIFASTAVYGIYLD